jgi:hypothetical protein
MQIVRELSALEIPPIKTRVKGDPALRTLNRRFPQFYFAEI